MVYLDIFANDSIEIFETQTQYDNDYTENREIYDGISSICACQGEISYDDLLWITMMRILSHSSDSPVEEHAFPLFYVFLNNK